MNFSRLHDMMSEIQVEIDETDHHHHHSTEILSKLFEFAIDDDDELPPSRFLSF